MRRPNTQRLLRAAAFTVCATGCIDNTIRQQPISDIAVVTGDFDHMSDPLDRMLIAYKEYEGFICCASYDTTVDPDANAMKVESLFTGETEAGGQELFLYDAVFLNSGSRGWGAYEYNGVGDDDHFLKDPAVLQNIEEFVNRGGVLVLTDWTYDLIEAIWPDVVSFYGEGGELDAAQVGLIGTVEAKVADEVLSNKLEQESVNITYNFSNWTIIESVSEGVEVYLTGDANYRISASEGNGTLSDVPLLISFEKGGGQVIFASFHWAAQNPELSQVLMTEVIEGFSVVAQGGDL